MKIDEASINHNVVKLINELMLMDMIGNSDDNLRIMAIGYIQGLYDLADNLKIVLSA